MGLFTPKFKPETYERGWGQLVLLDLRPYCNTIYHRDKVYRVPLDPAYVMSRIKIKNKYVNDRFDCDDFVRVFRAELSKLGYGDLLAMDVTLTTPNGLHALIGFWHNAQLIFGEPQTSQIVDIKYEWINRITL